MEVLKFSIIVLFWIFKGMVLDKAIPTIQILRRLELKEKFKLDFYPMFYHGMLTVSSYTLWSKFIKTKKRMKISTYDVILSLPNEFL